MASSYTTSLGLVLPVQGELTGTWGTIVNRDLTNYLDSAVAGATTITGSSDVTLVRTTNSALIATSSQYAILLCTPTANISVLVPNLSKTYVVINSSPTYSVTIKGVTGPTTGVTVIAGEKALVAWNGSDFVKAGAATGGSNTQVQYNNSGALAGSANLTFNGTTLTSTGFSGPLNGSVGATTPSTGVFTTVNKVTITAPATAATLTIANNKTFTVNNTVGLTGTDGTTFTLPSTSATAARTDAAQTFTGVQTFNSYLLIQGVAAGQVASAYGSTVLGYQAGGLAGAGMYGVGNTCVGSRAGTDFVDAFSNVAIGNDSMKGHTGTVGFNSYGGNTCVGADTMSQPASGAQSAFNVCVGTSAGQYLGFNGGNGDYNTYVGWHAGQSVMGDGNTVIGCIDGTGSPFPSPNYGTGVNGWIVLAGGQTPRVWWNASGYMTCPGLYANTTGSSANLYVDSNGLTYRSTSSQRYKTDIQNAPYGLSDVLALRPVTYKHVNDGDKIHGGLIAEEVDAAGLTQFVNYDDQGRPDSLDYGNMVSLLVKAVQELTARVAELEAKNA